MACKWSKRQRLWNEILSKSITLSYAYEKHSKYTQKCRQTENYAMQRHMHRIWSLYINVRRADPRTRNMSRKRTVFHKYGKAKRARHRTATNTGTFIKWTEPRKVSVIIAVSSNHLSPFSNWWNEQTESQQNWTNETRISHKNEIITGFPVQSPWIHIILNYTSNIS